MTIELQEVSARELAKKYFRGGEKSLAELKACLRAGGS